MDPLLTFMSWQFVLFSLGIAAITYVVRTVIEYFVTDPKYLNPWEDLILPLIPIPIGILMAYFAVAYPFPIGISSVSSRLIFGAVSGLVSTVTYRAVWGIISAKIQSIVNSATGSKATDDKHHHHNQH